MAKTFFMSSLLHPFSSAAFSWSTRAEGVEQGGHEEGQEDMKKVLAIDIDTNEVEKQIVTGMEELSLDVDEIYYNSPPGTLYEQALRYEDGSAIVSSGALAVKSGKKTGRSPLDKGVVFEDSSAKDVWWGKVNV